MEELLKKYIEENNIKSYLSYGLDSEKLKEIFKKNYIFKDEDELDDEVIGLIEQQNYMKAMEIGDIKKISRYIYGCEFDIEINKDGKIDLIDMQGAYLGGIDTYENFDTIMSASERLEGSYYYDYFGIELL